MGRSIHIVLAHENPNRPDMTFVEIEDDRGRGICIGKQVKDARGYLNILITADDITGVFSKDES